MGIASAPALGLVPSPTSGKSLVRLGEITKEQQRERRIGRMQKNVLTSARLHVEEAQQGGFRGKWAMLTLTYREDAKWVARQVSDLLAHIRKFAQRCGFPPRYVWVLELTKRLRPHYHVLVWLPKGRTLPKPDKQGWWPHGATRIEWARKAVGYLAKYASKGGEMEMAALPKGSRLSGFGGLSKESRIERRWWMSPLWVRQVFSEVCDLSRVVGGGFVNRTTGEFLASPWRVIWFGGTLQLCKVEA